MLLHRCRVLVVVADRQKPAVNFRMQGLDPAVHHFGKAGHLCNIDHFQPGVRDRLPGSTGRNQRDTAIAQCAREVDQAGLV